MRCIANARTRWRRPFVVPGTARGEKMAVTGAAESASTGYGGCFVAGVDL